MSDLLVDVASAKSGLEAFDVLSDSLEPIAAFIPTIKKVGAIDVDFSDAVQNAILAMPETLTKAVAKNGYVIVLAETVTVALPRLAGKTPRGYSGGSTWENADGLATNRKIIIAEYAKTFPNNKIVRTSNARASALIRHEYGHAIDRIYQVSDIDYFVKAYNEDAQKIINNPLIEQSDDLNYALQRGIAGRQEVFADIFAKLHGGGTAETVDLIALFPQTTNFINRWLKSV